MKKKALPKTVKEAVDYIINGMDSESIDLVKNTKEEKGELIMFHHGWGTAIRNGLKLWGGNKELLEDTGEDHPDDASMVIIKAVWSKLNELPIKAIVK